VKLFHYPQEREIKMKFCTLLSLCIFFSFGKGGHGRPSFNIWSFSALFLVTDTRWRSRLIQCAASLKVADSIPGGVIGMLHCLNSSGRTTAVESNYTLTEMSTCSISWWYKWPLYRVDKLAILVCCLSRKPENLNLLQLSAISCWEWHL